MPIINVNVLGACRKEQKKEMIEKFITITNKTFAIPADKIAVIIHENQPENWGQAAVVASDPEYDKLSRRDEL